MFFGRFASGPRAIVRVQCAQALIMGSIEQPDSIEKGLDFYDDKQDVQIHEGETPGAGISIGKSDWGRVLESQGFSMFSCSAQQGDRDCCVLHSRSALPGVYQVFKHYTKMSSQPRTIALRDFYQGF